MNVFSFMVGKKNVLSACWTGSDSSTFSSISFGFPLERRAGLLLVTEVGLGAGKEELDLVLFGDLDAGVFFFWSEFLSWQEGSDIVGGWMIFFGLVES
jgi:hypothetical protein